ncbi:MAG: tetratricopeptide repeat protein [Acidobacteriota bacterium]|nr:tetratricopeptide repeat protein [Acidobacteriota bacterium]
MKQPDRQSTRSRDSEAEEAAQASAHRQDSAPDGVICQVCGEVNGEDQEYCRRCHHKLLVISGPVFEEDMVFEHSEDDGFSFDEHLLERISILEEVVKRSAESLRQLLAAVKKQERNVLINNTGLTVLGELLEEHGVLEPNAWSERWQGRMDEHLSALERRERFQSLRERITGLYHGPDVAEFEDRLTGAEAALGAYDGEAALRSLESALELAPDNYELAYLVGEIHFDDGEMDAALELFERALERRPDHYDSLLYAGALHYQRGDTERAAELLERAAAVQPDAFLPHFSLGAVHASSGELELAVERLERAVEIDVVPQALYLLGSCLYELGRLGEAIQRLQQAVKIRPAFEEALQLLGLAYLDRRWNRKALAALSRAQRLSPKRMRYRDLVLYLLDQAQSPAPPSSEEAQEWFARAYACLERDDLDRALTNYRRALALEPENPLLLMSYALLCLQLDRGREIEAVSWRVLELEPDEALKATAYATLIEALRSQGKYREGNRIGRQLLAEGASDFSKTIAYYEMAYNLAEMEENLDQALDYARRSVELSPAELRQLPLAALGWVHYKRHEYSAAIDSLSRASELAPSATTLNHLGMVLLASGQQDQAREVLAEARSLGQGEANVEEKMIETVRENRRMPEAAPPRPKK